RRLVISDPRTDQPLTRDYQTALAGLDQLERTILSAGKSLARYRLALGAASPLLAHLTAPFPEQVIGWFTEASLTDTLAALPFRLQLLARLDAWHAWGLAHDPRQQALLAYLTRETNRERPGGTTAFPPGAHNTRDGLLLIRETGTAHERRSLQTALAAAARIPALAVALQELALVCSDARPVGTAEKASHPVLGSGEE
ncbi:MAG TPA: hypothetical protein VNL71_15190, partial [Chloroflexota bacterium]|nr:hypothetical protein [Chloroflexota bacterium]